MDMYAFFKYDRSRMEYNYQRSRALVMVALAVVSVIWVAVHL